MPQLRDESSNNPNNKRALNFIERVTSKADVVQKQVLSSILSRNAHTEYLTRHGLQGATDRATFKKKVPIVTYEDIQPYIRRIANGDTSPVLCSEPISEFLTSSGTSGGESKLMPTIDEEMGRRRLLYNLLMPVMDQYVKGLDKGKAMNLLFVKSEKRTPGGLLARPVLTSYYKSKHFREAPYDPYNVLTSPKEAILCQDHFQSMYAQLLCGLLQNKEVLRVGAVFASGFIRAIHFLQEHWPSLCHDIATGTLSTVVKDPSVREGVQKILKGPNKELALAIQQECCKDSWKGIITRIWPNTKYIDVIVTGAMAQYIHTLQFYGNNLPLVCTMYASSECYFGLNLNPLTPPSNVSYTILPNMAYFEFLPVTHGDDSTTQQPVDLVDVKVGQEYELVVTTYAGLCRYRVGDVLRVTGFHNKAPQFHFICRKNVGLSIDVDKTDEAELHKAVENAVKNLEPFGVKLLEYTSYADTSTVPGHYVLFWEMDTGEGTVEVPASVFEDCCLTLEESLSSVYKNCRAEKSVGPLEIRVVAQRAFDELMDYALSKGASINQYKAPRCVNSGPIVDLFQSKVINSYFSPKAPKRVNF